MIENLYSVTGLQWLIIFGSSIAMGFLLFLLGHDLNHRLKLFGVMTIGTFIIIIIGRMYLWSPS